MPRVPPLTTERLLIRPFTEADLDAVHRILDRELAGADLGAEGATTREARRRWLGWTILGYDEYAALYQPPYGERAIALRATGEVIGVAGFVPCLDAFGQLPALRGAEGGGGAGLNSTEFGLFWAVAPAHQRRGYATEAARALVDFAFARLRLRRIVATTTADNAASIGVMRRLGMRVERNPLPDPPWLQVVGSLERGRAAG